MEKIRVTVWNENVHEREMENVRAIYPKGIHGCIADVLNADPRFTATPVSLDMPEQGLPDDLLNQTDVLFWWGHAAHGQVDDALVERVWERVMSGMGLIVLHSGHYSKIFKRLMGTRCRSRWRESGDLERLFVVEPGHPIAEGLPAYFELPHEETYGERFDIPTPDELVFLSWFSGGEVLRSGCCWHRGFGKVFYFRPGHEEFPTYYDKNIQTVLRNAAAWAAPVHGPEQAYGEQPSPQDTARTEW